MTRTYHYDAVIAGGGPAGCACALRLAQSNLRVVILNRLRSCAPRIGESLPPAVRPLLERLQAWAAFRADQHLPASANVSAWGSPVLGGSDFMRNPYGCGWHLERQRFDQTLQALAESRGVKVVCGGVKGLRRTHRGWLVDGDRGGQLLAPFVVDATGRGRRLVKHLGVEARRQDKLIAFAVWLQAPSGAEADTDSVTLVEAASEGWWYTARIPGERRVVVYHTDADLISARLAARAEGFAGLLERTQHVRSRVLRYAYRRVHGPQPFAASTSRLEQFHGADWIAVGDAALTVDPLSSRGVLQALESGISAADCIRGRMQGQPEIVSSYGAWLEQTCLSILVSRRGYYRLEQRWPGSEFWRRRHMPDPIPPST